MYKVTYTPPLRDPIPFGSSVNLYVAQQVGRLILVEWNIDAAMGDESRYSNIEHTRDDWRPLAERTIKIEYKQESDTVWVGVGYDGGSIISPPLQIIRIELEV